MFDGCKVFRLDSKSSVAKIYWCLARFAVLLYFLFPISSFTYSRDIFSFRRKNYSKIESYLCSSFERNFSVGVCYEKYSRVQGQNVRLLFYKRTLEMWLLCTLFSEMWVFPRSETRYWPSLNSESSLWVQSKILHFIKKNYGTLSLLKTDCLSDKLMHWMIDWVTFLLDISLYRTILFEH